MLFIRKIFPAVSRFSVLSVAEKDLKQFLKGLTQSQTVVPVCTFVRLPKMIIQSTISDIFRVALYFTQDFKFHMYISIPECKAMPIPFRKPTGYYTHKNMCMCSLSVSFSSLQKHCENQKNNEDETVSI